MVRLITALSVTLVVMGNVRADDKELAKLKGTWVVVEAKRAGEVVDRIKGDKLIFDGDKVTVVERNGTSKGTVKLDTGKKPKHIDFIRAEDEITLPAIYELEGDKLTLCIGRGDRPKELTSEEGTRHTLLVFEREKKEKE